ncbi:MAG TPA: threonine/serine dehydratase [Candidatus Omnitrophota bacterium]|nr:threonine/serine dehydratase [Candidatus Omnitrophota bacterium]
MSSLIPIQAIREAAARTADRLHRTPVLTATTLGERAGARLHLKCESFQKTGSFKPRGALNVVLSMEPERRARGLITVSAGNHAQAVAWAARAAGVPCTVVMPADAPRSKTVATRGYGATIVPHPDRTTLFDRMREEEARTGAAFVHPFDDPVGLAGAGTLGLEIVEQIPDVACVVVPIGGGGLMAGVTSAVKALRPSCRVIGVELDASRGMTASLSAGKPIPIPVPRTLADGLTPPFVGSIPLAIARDALDEIVPITEPEIVEGMRWLLTRAKLYVEGGGAAATAALLSGKVRVPPGSVVVSVVSGGNVDPDRALAAIVGGDR